MLSQEKRISDLYDSLSYLVDAVLSLGSDVLPPGAWSHDLDKAMDVARQALHDEDQHVEAVLRRFGAIQ